MAGYIGTQAVSVNTTSATISDDLSVGDDLTVTDDATIGGTALVTGVLTTTAAAVFSGGFTSNGDTVTFTSANATDPLLIIQNTTNDAASARIRFVKDKGAAGADDDNIGTIEFFSDNAAQEQTQFALIRAEVAISNDGAEGGKLRLQVATHDGEMQSGLILADGNVEDEIDVQIAKGGASLTTIAGNATITSDLTVTGVSLFRDGTVSAPAISNTGDSNTGIFFPAADEIAFTEGGAERVRIKNNGDLLVSKTVQNSTVVGVQLNATGETFFTANAAQCCQVNRLSDDGVLITLQQANSTIGTISSSGSEVSYNAFSGSHWSRLTDNSQPTILKGTLIETIDEMCDWYQAVFTVPATTRVNEEGETVEDIAAQTMQESIALPDSASVGDTISHTYSGVTYSATIVKEDDNKHTKCKISDTADSTRIYGVFSAWDNDDDTVNDMYVTAVGTHLVRVHGGQTVAGGDLIVSNGDGTGKKQSDDIIRSKTLGKVLTNIKQETYADGSYTVPCALYCG